MYFPLHDKIFMFIQYYQNVSYIHFCDVLIPYYKIIILKIHYHIFNIASCGILFQNLHLRL